LTDNLVKVVVVGLLAELLHVILSVGHDDEQSIAVILRKEIKIDFNGFFIILKKC
jgi:hypothetical protein